MSSTAPETLPNWMGNGKFSVIGLSIGIISLTGIESYFRRNYPDSSFRPTIAMSLLTTKSRVFFHYLGYQFARLTDIYYIIKEYFPYEDIRSLCYQTYDLGSLRFG